MSNYEELEVKILNVDVEKMKEKLKNLNASYKKEVLQKIYTYDCYPPILMYQLALQDYKMTKSRYSLLKICNMYSYIEPIINESEKELIKSITGYTSLAKYILNNLEQIKVDILDTEEIIKIVRDSQDRFFKWIRLRQNGDRIEFTIKYIYSTEEEYDIDKVREYEINVDSLETANKIIEEMGYLKKKYIEKKRTSYELDGTKIEIDEWPLIKPYVEIEGESSEKIYDIVSRLGFNKDEAKVMNTDDVYLREGIDLNSYTELRF